MAAPTIEGVQQNFAYLYGYNNKIIWDFIHNDASLIKKIFSVIKDKTVCFKIYEKIKEQRKYTNGKHSLCAIIYVLFTDNKNLEEAARTTIFSCHPVFRTPKCRINCNKSDDCCMIFIDEYGNVYQNWKSYLLNNNLPVGSMVAPRNGIYTFDVYNNVILDKCATPGKELFSPDATPSGYSFATLTSSIYNIFTSSMGSSENATSDNICRWKPSGTANGILDIYLKSLSNVEITASNFNELDQSMYAVTHSLSNRKMANKIIENAQNNEIDSFREFFNKQQQRIFEQLSLHITRAESEVDIVRNINEIPDRKYMTEYFQSKACKYTKEDNFICNDCPGFSDKNYIDIAFKNILSDTSDEGIVNGDEYTQIRPILLAFGSKSLKIANRISNGECLRNVLLSMAESFGQSSINKFIIYVADKFIEEHVEDIENSINMAISSEAIIFKLAEICVCEYAYLKKAELEAKETETMDKLRHYFLFMKTFKDYENTISCTKCLGSSLSY